METVPNINTLQFKFLQYNLLWNILCSTECSLLPNECLTFMDPCLCLQFVVLGTVLQSCSICHCPLCLSFPCQESLLSSFLYSYAFTWCAIFFHVDNYIYLFESTSSLLINLMFFRIISSADPFSFSKPAFVCLKPNRSLWASWMKTLLLT